MLSKAIFYAYLRSQWKSVHRALAMKPDWAEFKRVWKAYGEKGRFYHSHAHIVYGLRLLDQGFAFKVFRRDSALLRLAFFYHDVVYDPAAHGGSNEQASADQLRSYLRASPLTDTEIGRLSALIVATKDHQAGCADSLWQYMNDADLAILAQPEKVYTVYASNVWKEYRALYSRKDFVKGRGKFLENFIQRPIFQTQYFRENCEKRAIDNLTAELANLKQEETHYA